MLTYGDGIGDVDLTALLQRHQAGGRTGTVTAVHPGSRYGEMKVDASLQAVSEFNEKPTLADGWVSGGFFAFQRTFVDDYLDDEPELLLERRPLQHLAADGQLTGTVAAVDLGAACLCAAAALSRHGEQPRLAVVLWATVAALVALGTVCALA